MRIAHFRKQEVKVNRKPYILGCAALAILIGCLTLLFFSVERYKPKEKTLLEKLIEHKRKYI